MQHRFEQIYSWLEKNKPKVILEIGTYHGKNAIHMIKSAKAERYIGFDVWEEGSDELDEIEFNIKKRVKKKDVEKLIKNSQVDGKKGPRGAKIELIQGNTRVTLEEYCLGKKPFVDVVIIDGGHSTHTIGSDFSWAIKIAKTSGTIFLDDYYHGVPKDNVGCNAPLAALNAPYTVLPKANPVFPNQDGKVAGQVKLVQVEMRDLQITDRWNVPEEDRWTFNPLSQSG